MDKRVELHETLVSILGSRNIYFQPPANISMRYPAIVYSRNNISSNYADNDNYSQTVSYKITVIDDDPDSEIVKKIAKLPKCSFNQHYTSDNLNHDVFTLFY